MCSHVFCRCGFCIPQSVAGRRIACVAWRFKEFGLECKRVFADEAVRNSVVSLSRVLAKTKLFLPRKGPQQERLSDQPKGGLMFELGERQIKLAVVFPCSLVVTILLESSRVSSKPFLS